MKPPGPTKYGAMLKRLIEQRGVTQTLLANRAKAASGLSISQARLNLVLRGRIKVPPHWVAVLPSAIDASPHQLNLLRMAAEKDHGHKLDIPPIPDKKEAPE
jgi:transcriptional regulator with XRE-family HTH domain